MWAGRGPREAPARGCLSESRRETGSRRLRVRRRGEGRSARAAGDSDKDSRGARSSSREALTGPPPGVGSWRECRPSHRFKLVPAGGAGSPPLAPRAWPAAAPASAAGTAFSCRLGRFDGPAVLPTAARLKARPRLG